MPKKKTSKDSTAEKRTAAKLLARIEALGPAPLDKGRDTYRVWMMELLLATIAEAASVKSMPVEDRVAEIRGLVRTLNLFDKLPTTDA